MTTDNDSLREKIPWLNSGRGKAILMASFALPFCSYLLAFIWLSRIHAWGAVIGQMILSILSCAINTYVMQNAIYRVRRHYKLTHQLPQWAAPSYLAFVIALIFALMVTPLLAPGERLFPSWVAIPLGLFLVAFGSLVRRSAMTGSGFSLAHAFGIYLVIPQEGVLVDRGLYAYFRHPLSAGVICIAIGLGLIRNNPLSLLTALIYILPVLVEMKLEDNELIDRFGDKHRRYMQTTPALLPRLGDWGRVLGLILFRR